MCDRTVAGSARRCARFDGPAGGAGVTIRSMSETAAARATTVRLTGLSVRCGSDESAAIEDIPSSMQPKGRSP
jgi:hypothetical protein